ncbi:phenylalanyl-tRNA synthetase alpha chain [Fistulifera solaris]|uniref:phenylalanine--tRNA ligase n=1 Tax=Fistulifera solaris TaxID=1519565 RepID=A0A1Z5KFD4_FISSO|nr:phenylalanyl-tRNA synthetase alpha chain [Fistulifera solaris]|eukprot:GAX24916.1 phenylalanyl-tRNA synthetase alpha chain [Fistulifera solaris]
MILRRVWRCTRRSFSSFPYNRYPLDAPNCNVPRNIAKRVGTNLHRQPQHPLGILQRRILEFWQPHGFQLYDQLSPIVSTTHNFDHLRIPSDHVSRSPSDTYYLNATTVLRTHTSAHQHELLKTGQNRFLVAGDVYRRDEIDRSHYPIFHQMEGVKIFAPHEQNLIQSELKESLEQLAEHLFGQHITKRWIDTYFPFTEPSFELEILFEGEWLEVLGCGVIHPEVLAKAGRGEQMGYAFGLGLERLAMVLFQIPDIRLFWTHDERFHRQFASGEIVRFEPYSKFPPCFKDISFWLESAFHVNDLNEIVRDVAGDLVERVWLIDDFVHPKTGKTSHCYRIAYRSMDRSLTNEEIDDLQEVVRNRVVNDLGVILR